MSRTRIRAIPLALVAVAAATVIGFLPLAGPASAAPVHAAASASGGNYVPVTPTRITDTRTGSGQPNAGMTLAAGASLKVTPGSGLVPAGATAVAITVTAVDATAPGFLTVYPDGTTQPLESVVNFVAGAANCTIVDCVVPNQVITQVSSAGSFDVANGAAGSVDVVIDLQGFFNAPSATTGGAGHYYPLSPARVADTRCGDSPPGAGSNCSAESIPANNASLATLNGNQTVAVQVAGDGGVPSSGVAAAVVELTVANTTNNGYLTAWAAGSAPPTTSNVNWVGGQITANRAIVPVGTNGAIDVFNFQGKADVIVDVVGWISDSTGSATGGSLFNPVAPVRLGDTRSPTPAPLVAGQTGALQVSGSNGVPSGATSAVLNVTEATATVAGFLTVSPAPLTLPVTTSDVNFSANEIRANADLATLSSGGGVSIYNFAGMTNVVVDLFGYFVSALPPSTQTFTVTPGGTANAPVTTTTVAETATGLGTAPVDIQLFSCANVASGSPTTFPHSTNPGGTGNFAVQGASAATITVLNGAAITPASTANGVTPTGGSVTFSFTDGTSECVVPVVFVQGAAGATQNQLPLGTTNAPTVAFGLGQATTFTPPAAPTGVFGGGGTSAPTSTVTQDGITYFVTSAGTYTYKATDTFQLWNGTSCAPDSLSDFQARLTLSDGVGGVFNPTAASTFCLNDIAPAPPTVSVAKEVTSAGAKVTITQPSGVVTSNAITNYEVFRAAASPPAITGAPYTCPTSSAVAGSISPQAAPGSAYTALANLVASGGTVTYDDTTVSAGTSVTMPNAFCYAVSAVATNAGGGSQTGTAGPANATDSPPLTSGTATANSPAPEVPANAPVTGGAPVFASATAHATGVTVTYNGPLNLSTIDTNGSQFRVTWTTGGSVNADTVTAATATTPSVTLTVNMTIPVGATVTVTVMNGGSPTATTVCAVSSLTLCEPNTDAVVGTAT